MTDAGRRGSAWEAPEDDTDEEESSDDVDIWMATAKRSTMTMGHDGTPLNWWPMVTQGKVRQLY